MLIGAIWPLMLDAGRIKVYSCDSVAGQCTGGQKAGSVAHRCWLLNQFHDYVANEVVPAIRCRLQRQCH